MDPSQRGQVLVGEAARAPARAPRGQQSAALVVAQRLGVHPRELGEDRDDVDGVVVRVSHRSTSLQATRARLLDERALLLVQLLRHRHVDGHEQVARGVLARARARRGPRTRIVVPAAVPAGILRVTGSSSVGNLDGRCRASPRYRHVDASWSRGGPGDRSARRGDVDVDEEVAGRSAVDAGVALALEPDPLAVDRRRRGCAR